VSRKPLFSMWPKLMAPFPAAILSSPFILVKIARMFLPL
jgi:hypothetical protein